MRGDDFIKAELARISYLDAKDEGISGMLGVAFVIRNRIRAGWFAGDWINLLSHHQDYSGSSTPPTAEIPDPRNSTFHLLLQQIDGIFNGTTDDTVTAPNFSFPGVGKIEHSFAQPTQQPAMYYARLSDPNLKEKFIQDISSNTEYHRQIASIGTLTFFS